MPQHLHRFQIDYHGKGYLGVPSPAPGLRLPQDPLDDPWLVCALALEGAKRGDFRLMPVLVDLYGATADTPLDHMCLGLLTSAGTAGCFARIADRMARESDIVRLCDLCGALSVRGELAHIPLILDVYLSHEGTREAERLTDYIGAMVGDALFAVQADDYEDAVMACWARMVARFESPHTLVFQGERHGVVPLARYVLAHLGPPNLLLRWKFEFEAATGKDCSAWHRGTQPQPLAAAAALEEFFDSGEAAGYEDGVRYFFGHRIDAE